VPSARSPVDSALGTVLAEIDQNAKATFSSITLATMLRLIERQQASAAAIQAKPVGEATPARAALAVMPRPARRAKPG
jgi:hypothetical protein